MVTSFRRIFLFFVFIFCLSSVAEVSGAFFVSKHAPLRSYRGIPSHGNNSPWGIITPHARVSPARGALPSNTHTEAVKKHTGYKYMLYKLEAYIKAGNIYELLDFSNAYLLKSRSRAADLEGITFKYPARVDEVLSLALAFSYDVNKAKLILKRVGKAVNSNYGLMAKSLFALYEKNYKTARRFLHLAMEMDDKNPLVYDIEGYINSGLGRKNDAIRSFRKAISVAPDSSIAYAELAALFLADKKTNLALKYYKAAAVLAPHNHKNLYGMALCYIKNNNMSKAIEYLTKCIEKDDAFAPAHAKLGDVYFNTARYEDSLGVGQKLVLLGRRNLGTLFMGRALFELGRYDEALEVLDTVMEGNSPPLLFLNLKLHMALALGNMSEVLRYIDEVSKQNILDEDKIPYLKSYLLTLAYCQAYSGDIESAIKLVQSGMEKNFFSLKPNFFLAQLEILNGNAEKAEKYLKSTPDLVRDMNLDSLELSEYVRDKSPCLERFRAGIFLLKEWFATALRINQEILKTSPNDFITSYIAGKIAGYSNDSELMNTLLKRTIKIEPSFISAQVALGDSYVQARNYQAALEPYKAVAELLPHSPYVSYIISSIYEVSGQRDKAYALLMNMTKRFPYFAFAFNQLAWISIEKGENLNKALEWARRADELLPGTAYIKDTIGWWYLKNKEYKKAEHFFKQALNLSPNFSASYHHLSLLYKEQGLKDKALLFIKKASDYKGN